MRRTILVGGCSRSGTTMMGDLLGGIDRAVVTPESPFKADVARLFASGGPEASTKFLQSSFRFMLWETKLDSAFLRQAEGVDDYLWRLVQLYAHTHGLPEPEVWIDHTPGNLSGWVRIEQICPNPCFVHAVRDGRAVAASVLPLDWGPNSIWYAAQWWSEAVAVGLAMVQQRRLNICQAKFEDVVSNKEEALDDICRSLDVQNGFSPKGRSFIVPSYTAQQHQLVGAEVRAERSSSWKETLTARQVEIFESISGGLLAALGYELDYQFPQKATRYELFQMREWPVIIRQRAVKKLRNWRRKKGASIR